MTSFFKLFNAKDQNADRRRGRALSPLKPRKLMTEALEERQLLAVDMLMTAAAGAANVIQISSAELSVDAVKQAIAQASATPEDDVIQIDSGSLQFASEADEFVINVNSSTKGSITIVAADKGLTIDANSLARAFSIKSGDVTLKNVTLVNGVADYGGAIANAGNLTLVDVTLKNNLAMTSGGAVANKGALTVEDSLIAGNGAMDSGSAIYEGDFSWPSTIPSWSAIPEQIGSKGSTISVDLNDYVNDGDWTYSYSIADTSSVILANAPTLRNGVLTFTFIDDADYYAEDDYSALNVTVTATDGRSSASTSFSVSLAEQTSVTLAAILSNKTFAETEAQYRKGVKNRVLGYASDDGIPDPSIVNVSNNLSVQIWLQDFDWTEYENKIWDAGDFYIMGIEYRLHLENATIDEFTQAADLARDSYVYKQLDNGDYEFIVVYTAGSNFGYEEALLLDVLPIQAINPTKPVSATIYQINNDFTYPCVTRLYNEPTPRDPSRSHINVDPSQTLFISSISNSASPLSAIPGQPFATSTFATLDESPELFSNAVSASTATTSLYNVTITGNASSSANGAIYLQAGATAAIYNSIVAVNTGGDVVAQSGASAEAYRVLSSYVAWSNSGAVSYLYNAHSPLFTDAAAGDYTLAEGSQALDKGDNAYVRNARDLAGKPRVQNTNVDLGAYEHSEPSSLAFTYDATTRKATLTWDAIDGATSYTVKLSKNNGETWSNYTRTSGLTATVSGLYAGKSYDFQIVANDSSGATLPTVYEATFAPISLSSNVAEYSAGDTINLTLTAAANGGARIRWYQITGDGDVEIVAARGLLSYTPSHSEYDLRVVAEGVDDSLGAEVELTIPTTAAQIEFNYSSSARKAILTWNAISNAATYTVKVSKDGGATWANYVRGVTGLTATVAGLYAGKSYDFQVYGVDASGATLATVREATFAPISVAASADSYSAGDLLTLTVTGAENASADVRWYQITGDGDVEIVEAAGLFEYVPSSDAYDLKAVVTGVGDSAGADATLVFTTTVPQLYFDYAASSRQAQLTWNGIQGAATYTVKISKDGGATWSNYVRGVTDVTTTVSGIYVGKSYDFKVYGVDVLGVTLDTVRGATLAPIALAAASDSFVDGDTISLTLAGATNASADIRWYQITDEGDLEIVEAAGALEYAPESSQYDIRVVATGTGDSKGSVSEVVVSASRAQIAFDSDLAQRKATVSWPAIAGAASYKVQLSKTNGETWPNYKTGVTTTSIEAGGLYAGKSYGFRVYGVAAGGATLDKYYESFFAPIALAASSDSYLAGDAISLTLTAADDASADIRWYYVTDQGDVEIVEAAGALEYTPESSQYDIRVVATGTDNSAGSVSEVVVSASRDQLAFDYDLTQRKATVAWPAIAGAASYKVQLSKTNGETWPNYKTGVTTTSIEAGGLYAGKSYGFRVYGVAAGGATLDKYYESFFAPIALAASSDSYLAGDAISLTLTAADDASADIRWYYVTDQGDVEIVEAAGALEYAPSSSQYDIRVVATGTNNSLGSNAELTIEAVSASIAFEHDASTNQATLTWNAISGAASYTVKVSQDGGATWTNAVAGVAGVTATVGDVYAGGVYSFRVYGVDGSGAQLSSVRVGTLAPIAISTASTTYSANTAITLTTTADASASAEIRWYQLVDGSEVEIVSARDSLSYTPTSAQYDIKVVATGTGVSLGSNSSLTLTPASLGSVSLVRYTYTADVHQALVKWPTVPGAKYYNLEYSENGGETWKLYAKNFANYYKGVNGVYPGKTYDFRVTPLDANKQPMGASYIEGTIAPVALTSPAINYTAGTKIELTRLASADGTSTIKWYYVTDGGDVEIKSARNQLTFTPDVAQYDIKVVSTGTGLSLKCNYELTLSAQCALNVQFNYDAATRKAVMSWEPFADAATYTIKLSKNGGETWTTYKSNLTTPETTVSGLYTGSTYAFRIMAISSSKSTLATYQTTFSPSTSSSAALDEAFADFFEEELFEEF